VDKAIVDSAMAPSALPTVAVAGATGNLGKHIVQGLLSSSYRDKFNKIILLCRTPTEQTSAWEKDGATIVKYDEESLKDSLEGVDILINA
jgi:uncharacterized protein YbjT (DUF2867 family)